MIYLRKITEENFQDVINLKVNIKDKNFVDTTEYSLAEAWLNYKYMRPFAIYNEEQLIGYVSIYVKENEYQIINFLIDDNYHNKNYGTRAAKLCIKYLTENYNAKTISLPLHLENIRAKRFWTRLGFVSSDNIEDGYLFMRRGNDE